MTATAAPASVSASAPGAGVKNAQPLYLQIARTIEGQIRRGALRVGDKLPSIRALRRQQDVSVSTVLQAYFWLENRGWIEARPQSGFYVRVPYSDLPPEPAFEADKPKPTTVGVGDVIVEIMHAAADPNKVPLGAACPSPDLLPNRKLGQILLSIVRRNPQHSARYETSWGWEPLRRQIARRSLTFGCAFRPDEIIVTSGAMEAENLCLRAVARPGDVVAIESPTYWGVLQAIEWMGMKAVEIPTHCRQGMDLNVLEHAIRKHRVKACLVMTNCHNPLGYVLAEEKKKALVDLAAKYDVPIIEDDLYGDLAFDGRRPKPAKAFDRKGLVMLCSSFSKEVAPGFRIGWVQPGRFHAEVERLKLFTTVATASLQQMVVAEFLESGGYDRHMRRLRTAFCDQVQMYSKAIAKYFPEGTCFTRPDGGYLLWVQLPRRVSAMKLHHAAQAENISISPGPMFSASGRFPHHIRLNCGYPWSDRMDRALLTLGRLCDAAR